MTLFIAGVLLYHVDAEWYWYLAAILVWAGHYYASTRFKLGGQSH